MYSDKVEVLRFETEPYRKHLTQNGTSKKGSQPLFFKCTNNNNINHSSKHIIYQNGYHNALIETETSKAPPRPSRPSSTTSPATAAVVAAATLSGLGHLNHHLSPSDPVVASVLHPRQNPRPGRLLLENVNNRPQTMDRGTQANTEADATLVEEIAEAVQPPPPSTSNDPANAEMQDNRTYRNANISFINQPCLPNGGDSSSVDSLNSADSAKRDSEDSVIELAEFHQSMTAKDNTDGSFGMNNGDGKPPGADGGKSSNGIVKEQPVDEEVERTSCGMECLYFAMQCCECTIM